jgi:hypothetical protein
MLSMMLRNLAATFNPAPRFFWQLACRLFIIAVVKLTGSAIGAALACK